MRPTGDARARTRLLGFHADAVADALCVPDLSAPVAAPAPPVMFPVGWLVVIDGPGRGAAFALRQGLSTIGRGADQTVALDFGDESISRENHASVAWDEETASLFVGHGGKANVVRLNDAPLLSTEPLSQGDRLRIGRTTLRVVALCGPDFTWSDPDPTMGARGHA